MTASNYIRGDNPFNLQGPPAWWLQKLKDFDDSLVLIPSKMAQVYRLAQRRPPDARASMVHQLQGDSDSKQLASLGLVPVTTVISTVRWDDPTLFENLRQRMPSRMGGAQAFERLMDEQQAKREQADRSVRDNMLDTISKDALGYYKLKAGIRTSMYVPKTTDRVQRPTFGQSAAIRIAGKYDKLENHIKKPFSQR